MRNIDHKKLAKIIIDHYMSDFPESCKRAFYLGCVQPDFVVFSYFHGFLKHYTMHGHNYTHSCYLVSRLLKKLNESPNNKTLYFYRLGIIIHYVTDAFTHTHTSKFKGNLKAHQAYEQKLHIAFEKMAEKNSVIFPNNKFYDKKVSINASEIYKVYRCYLNSRVSVCNDLHYIFFIIAMIMNNYIV